MIDIEEVKKLAGLARIEMGDKELEKAKNQLEATFIFYQDSTFNQAMRIGQYESAVGWQLMNTYLSGIRKVTASDILSVAKKYFMRDRRTVGILIPTKGANEKSYLSSP